MLTAVVPISPIPSHPHIKILEETIASIRHWHPTAEIMLMFDGVRPEQESRRRDYEKAIQQTLWRADHHWGNTYPIIFEEHRHQIGMLRHTLDHIRTPLLMFVEQDTPLVVDEPIDWDLITKFIESGESNCVRLYHEAVTPKAHRHLMHGTDSDFTRTSQYSARPHVATIPFYRQLLTHFTPDANCFIEDLAHGIIGNDYLSYGMHGWNMWRTHIYTPGTTNWKRSYHTDGRQGHDKYDEKQVF